jgi:integrase
VARSWSQVDLKSGIVRLEPGTTKNDEGRTFPCSALPELGEVLQQLHERTKAAEIETGRIIPWVFHRNGRQIKRFRTQWQRACEEANVPGRYVHDLRRTAVRNFECAGVPRSVAMKLSGHKTESIYRRYVIVSESDLAEGVKKLGTLLKTDLSEPKKVVCMIGRRSS